MNTADYLSTTDYPVTTQGLDFIQNQILCLEQMAAAFGDGNWILSGMTEDAEGNLTPGVVALVENSKATVVNFTQGGVSASDLKNKHFRIDTTTNALPKRSYQFLIEDPDGEITAIDRIDIHELAEQIKDNAAAIAKNATSIGAVNAKKIKRYQCIELPWTGGNVHTIPAILEKAFYACGTIYHPGPGSRDFDNIRVVNNKVDGSTSKYSDPTGNSNWALPIHQELSGAWITIFALYYE